MAIMKLKRFTLKKKKKTDKNQGMPEATALYEIIGNDI